MGRDPPSAPLGVPAPPALRWISDTRAVFGEQLAQDRAVAARLVCAVAADREARVARERGEQVERAPVLRRPHFGAVRARERAPLALSSGGLPGLQRRLARREVREPDVVEVTRRQLCLLHPTCGSPDPPAGQGP